MIIKLRDTINCRLNTFEESAVQVFKNSQIKIRKIKKYFLDMVTVEFVLQGIQNVIILLVVHTQNIINMTALLITK